MNFSGKSILIVGASSGMGRIVAKKLATQGACLSLTARRQERLDSLKMEIEAEGGRCFTLAADATDESGAQSVVAATIAELGSIDILLVNAGGAPALDMRSMSAADVKAYMRSNYDVLVNYLFPVLEHMRERKSGLVVHTNSLAGLIGVPLQGPYCAAKGAAKLLMDTCRLEFAEFGIKFITIFPGFVATEATQDDGMPASMEISADEGADHIIKGIDRGKPEYLYPWRPAMLTRLAISLPASIRDKLLIGDVPDHEPRDSVS